VIINFKYNRRLLIAKAIRGSFSFVGLMSLLPLSNQNTIIVDTTFYSLKYPGKIFENMDEFWAAHPACNSRQNDLEDIYDSDLLPKRVFLKACKTSGRVLSRVIYRDMNTYIQHSNFLRDKYSLKISKKSKSRFVLSSDELVAIDKVSSAKAKT
jgi:hypothetical protein